MSVRDVATILHQQVLYTSERRRGYVQRVQSCSCGDQRMRDKFVGHRFGIGIFVENRGAEKGSDLFIYIRKIDLT